MIPILLTNFLLIRPYSENLASFGLLGIPFTLLIVCRVSQWDSSDSYRLLLLLADLFWWSVSCVNSYWTILIYRLTIWRNLLYLRLVNRFGALESWSHEDVSILGTNVVCCWLGLPYSGHFYTDGYIRLITVFSVSSNMWQHFFLF